MSSYEQMLESLGRPTYDPIARLRFVRAAGAIYGLLFTVGFAATFWFTDAIQLQQASVHLAWGKPLIGLLIGLPLGALAGWLASRWDRPLISMLIWAVYGVGLAWLSGHIPYDGSSLIASIGDPYPTTNVMYPYTQQAAAFTGIAMAVGALFGGMTGVLFALVVERAWDRSSSDHHLGRRSVLVLCACLPLGMLYGFFADMAIHQPMRRPLTDVAWAINIALDPRGNLAENQISFLAPYRGDIRSPYTLYWNSTRNSIVESESGSGYQTTDVIDAVFSSGLILRCNYISGGPDHPGSGEVAACSPLSNDLRVWMKQILTRTHTLIQTTDEVRRWLDTLSPPAGAVPEITLLQHQGGWLYERARLEDGRLIDCRFVSSEPIVVDLCAKSQE